MKKAFTPLGFLFVLGFNDTSALVGHYFAQAFGFICMIEQFVPLVELGAIYSNGQNQLIR